VKEVKAVWTWEEHWWTVMKVRYSRKHNEVSSPETKDASSWMILGSCSRASRERLKRGVVVVEKEGGGEGQLGEGRFGKGRRRGCDELDPFSSTYLETRSR